MLGPPRPSVVVDALENRQLGPPLPPIAEFCFLSPTCAALLLVSYYHYPRLSSSLLHDVVAVVAVAAIV